MASTAAWARTVWPSASHRSQPISVAWIGVVNSCDFEVLAEAIAPPSRSFGSRFTVLTVAGSAAMWRNISCGRWLKRWQRAQPIFGGVGGDNGALAAFARTQ